MPFTVRRSPWQRKFDLNLPLPDCRIHRSFILSNSVGYGDICPGELTFIGKVFIVLFALGGIGIFVGPIMDLASSWRLYVPGGLLTLLSLTVGIGVAIFTMIEGIPQSEAIYASIITGKSKDSTTVESLHHILSIDSHRCHCWKGTTIGYGDISPSTDLGKIAIALYMIAAINVVAAFLSPARQFLEHLCRVEVAGSSKQD